MTEQLLITENDADLQLVALGLGAPVDKRMEGALARFFGPRSEELLSRLRSLGQELGLAGQVEPVTASPAPLEGQVGGCHFLYVEAVPVTAAVIEQAHHLEFIQKNGVDCRNIDQAAASERGVIVQTHRRRANIAAAEQNMLLMLATARRLPTAHQAALAGKPEASREPSLYNWAELEGMQSLWGATLGIVGLGEIGRELALRANSFGMRIVYYQRNRLDSAAEEEYGAAFRSLPELLAESDFVSLQVPLNESTTHLLGARELRQMRRNAFLINTSRGRLVDEAAMLEALREGHLGGVGLDVRYDEPPEENGVLSNLETAVLTPHVAAGTGEEVFTDARMVLENIAGFRRGRTQ